MTAIILAAGFSKRFGGQKLLMKIAGKPILLRVVETIVKSGFEEIILVCRHEEIEEIAKDKNIKVVYNMEALCGISSSVKCGISSSKPTEAYMFFTGDQPFIDEVTICALITAFNEGKGSIIVPKYKGVSGNPVIFAAEWKEKLEQLKGDTGGKSIIQAYQNKVYYVDVANIKAAMDIDTWEDYIKYNGVES